MYSIAEFRFLKILDNFGAFLRTVCCKCLIWSECCEESLEGHLLLIKRPNADTETLAGLTAADVLQAPKYLAAPPGVGVVSPGLPLDNTRQLGEKFVPLTG